MTMKFQRRSPPSRSGQSKSSDDEEINLYVNVNKTIAMKVKKSETVKNLKTMLHEKEGIREENQELEFDGGKSIWDGRTIKHFGICNNSTICVREAPLMTLYFKMPSKMLTFELAVKSMNTIGTVKFIIQSQQGIHRSEYTIYHAGEPLTDNMTVASLNIQRGDAQPTLYMISNPIDKLWIFVETPTEDVIKLQVRCTHSIDDVKKIVECRTNLSSEDWDLFSGTKRLDNVKTLAFFDIKEADMLKMLGAMFKIFVETRSGETVTLETQETNGEDNK